MKIALIIVVSLVVIACLYLVIISLTAAPVKTGLVDSKLGPCAGKPNCVNSEHQGENYISPITLQNIGVDDQWKIIKE